MRINLVRRGLLVALSLVFSGNDHQVVGQEQEPVEITVRKIMGGDKDAIEKAGKSGQQIFVPYLRHLLETRKSATSYKEYWPERIALAKLGQVKELQEFWCLAITDDPKKGVWPNTLALELIGGWYAIQGLQKFLKPQGLIHRHKPTRDEINSDALEVPIEEYALDSLARVVENRPPPLSGPLLVEPHDPNGIAIWQQRIALSKAELSKRWPTGEGVNFSAAACKDGKPILQGVLPFQMALLAGYRPRQSAWNETRTGEISKNGGLLIRYDITRGVAGEAHEIRPVEQWKRECAWKTTGYPKPGSDTADVICWIDDEGKGQYPGTLHVSFTDLTEFWTRVKSEQQANEALKMLLTYDPRVPSR